MEEQLAAEVPASDTEIKDVPQVEEEAKSPAEEQAPETVTLTKDELEKQKNAIAKRERERAERKYQRQLRETEEKLRSEFSAKEPAKPEGKPKIDDFASFEEFNEALIDWRTNEVLKQRDSKQKLESENSRRESMWENHHKQAEKFRESTPDYDETIASLVDYNIHIGTDVIEAITSSDRSPEIYYYLAKNIDEFEKLSEMSPLAAAREIGKIEAKLQARPVKTTQAPAPINPVSSKSNDSGLNDNLDTEEWIRRRNAQLRKR